MRSSRLALAVLTLAAVTGWSSTAHATHSIRFKLLGGIPAITFKIQAFGDLSAATLAHMTTQISIGNDGTFVDGEWQRSATGWRLTSANLRQR